MSELSVDIHCHLYFTAAKSGCGFLVKSGFPDPSTEPWQDGEGMAHIHRQDSPDVSDVLKLF